MSEKIEPALSAKEWAREGGRGAIDRQHGPSDGFWAYRPLGVSGTVVGFTGGSGVAIPDECEEAVAALLIAGYFTWEMVDAIRLAADTLDAENGFEYEGRHPKSVLAEAAADRLAALLPPREP